MAHAISAVNKASVPVLFVWQNGRPKTNDKKSKISPSALQRHLWEAAHILNGSIDASDYKTYIFPILFFKRVCDEYSRYAKVRDSWSMSRLSHDSDAIGKTDIYFRTLPDIRAS